jgi:hypothetical protein
LCCTCHLATHRMSATVWYGSIAVPRLIGMAVARTTTQLRTRNACLQMCRFLDAGMQRSSTRSGGRRPKSAEARNRGGLGTAVDMLDLEPYHLAGAQAAAIAETEQHAIFVIVEFIIRFTPSNESSEARSSLIRLRSKAWQKSHPRFVRSTQTSAPSENPFNNH